MIRATAPIDASAVAVSTPGRIASRTWTAASGWASLRCSVLVAMVVSSWVVPDRYTISGRISMAPHGHSCAHRPQPLQKSRSTAYA